MDESGEEALRAKLIGLERTAWRPVTVAGDGPVTASKFSGTPWLSPREPWPICPRCREPMALFLQLDLAGLPREVGAEVGDGLLQMFSCTSRAECSIRGEGCWEPFSPYKVLRRVHPNPGEPSIPPPVLARPIPARTITGWDATDDLPDAYEAGDYGVEVQVEEMDIFDGDYPRQGDKLAGWPAWVQHVDYPRCRQCGRWMRLVFQIDSNCNLWYMFGDDGCGHITQCPEHLDELAFLWAGC